MRTHLTELRDHLTDVEAYCTQHSTDPNEILNELERETHLKTLAPQMMSGRLQGQFLQLISRLVRPRRILEIGTFTGYATLCLAAGLTADGRLHTIEVNEELAYLIRKYLRKAKLEHRVELHLGDAHSILPGLTGQFDLVFIDAGKRNNMMYYEWALQKANPGGVILVDNTLWSGKVITDARDEDTRSVRAFNAHVQDDVRVDTVLLPLRDGLTVVRVRD